MRHINIIRWDNGAGLSRTAKIIADVLRNAGCQVTINGVYSLPLTNNLTKFDRFKRFAYTRYLTLKQSLQLQLMQSLNRLPVYDINIFCEQVEPMWFPYARVNCLVPNQEWFFEQWRPYLSQFDWILCKTKFAQKIFDELGCKTQFISFTSNDRLLEIPTDYNAFFHLAGRSSQKGTSKVVEVWQRHPEWPKLTVIQNPLKAQPIAAENINYINQYLDDTLLRQYQNENGIHLCPSEAEGFGHYIVEAMSCKGLAITTNAPPMNELVTEERGILVNYSNTQVQRLGINYYVDPVDLEEKIDKVLGMDWGAKQSLGKNTREWYQQNDRFFKHKLVETIEGI